MKARIVTLQAWWTTGTTVYEQTADPAVWERERRLDEYPENQLLYWASTANELDELMQEAHKLRTYCIEQWNLLDQGTHPTEGDQ
jgi:hypothetical protein